MLPRSGKVGFPTQIFLCAVTRTMNPFKVHLRLFSDLRLVLAEQYPSKLYLPMSAYLTKDNVENILLWFAEIDPEVFSEPKPIPKPSKAISKKIKQASQELQCPIERLGVSLLQVDDVILVGLIDIDSFLKENPIFVV